MRVLASIVVLLPSVLLGCGEREVPMPEIVVGSVQGLTALREAKAEPGTLKVTEWLRSTGSFAARNGCILLEIGGDEYTPVFSTQEVETQVAAALTNNDGRQWEVHGAPASAAQNDAYHGRTGGCEPPLYWLDAVGVPDRATSVPASPPKPR